MSNLDIKQEQVATNEDIMEWLRVKEELAKVKAKEVRLRTLIVKSYFHDAKEGTNTHDLDNGYKFKYNHKLARSIDEAMLTNLTHKLNEVGVNIDTLVEKKLSLKLRNWKDLDEEQRVIFDECLTIKPATGTLEFIVPKETD